MIIPHPHPVPFHRNATRRIAPHVSSSDPVSRPSRNQRGVYTGPCRRDATSNNVPHFKRRDAQRWKDISGSHVISTARSDPALSRPVLRSSRRTEGNHQRWISELGWSAVPRRSHRGESRGRTRAPARMVRCVRAPVGARLSDAVALAACHCLACVFSGMHRLRCVSTSHLISSHPSRPIASCISTAPSYRMVSTPVHRPTHRTRRGALVSRPIHSDPTRPDRIAQSRSVAVEDTVGLHQYGTQQFKNSRRCFSRHDSVPEHRRWIEVDGVRGRNAGARTQALLRARTTRTETGAVYAVTSTFESVALVPLLPPFPSFPSHPSAPAVRYVAEPLLLEVSPPPPHTAPDTAVGHVLHAYVRARVARGRVERGTRLVSVSSLHARKSTSSMRRDPPQWTDLLHLDVVHRIRSCFPPSGPASPPLQRTIQSPSRCFSLSREHGGQKVDRGRWSPRTQRRCPDEGSPSHHDEDGGECGVQYTVASTFESIALLSPFASSPYSSHP
ncbi:hypothetical protein C8R45DRAFT_1005216 [Mycena sanguinolenta]|nr:hypothetical protein C8R45DRAFT_1005216 [Mycena sanguinolenta]